MLWYKFDARFPPSLRDFVFSPAFLYKFIQFEFWVKDAMGTVDHVQIAEASLGPVAANTCRSNSTSNRIISECVSSTLRYLI